MRFFFFFPELIQTSHAMLNHQEFTWIDLSSPLLAEAVLFTYFSLFIHLCLCRCVSLRVAYHKPHTSLPTSPRPSQPGSYTVVAQFQRPTQDDNPTSSCLLVAIEVICKWADSSLCIYVCNFLFFISILGFMLKYSESITTD